MPEKVASHDSMDQVNHDRRNADFASPYAGTHNVIRVMLKRPLRKSLPQRPL